jgi:hypothetical protein
MARRFYYECLRRTDLGYWGPQRRREREGKGMPTKVQHIAVVLPSRGMNTRGEELPPDYIVTDKPLGKQYIEQMTKKVSRPSFDSESGRRNGRYYRRKLITPKFRLLDPDEVDWDIKKRAIDMDWQEVLFQTVTNQVDLPRDVAILDKTEPLGEGDEPEAGETHADEGGGLVNKRKRRTE